MIETRDTFACVILVELMDRKGEVGYSDIAAISEAYSLADSMMEIRETSREKGTPSTCEGCTRLMGRSCLIGTSHCTRRAEDYYEGEK